LETGKRRITFLFWEDCQSQDDAVRRLKKVLAEERMDAEIETICVQSEGEAKRLQFAGSPTILVDGKDIQPPTTAHYSLACRAYHLEDGRISPLPSESMIRKALKRES
jgi:hypothetical protein